MNDASVSVGTADLPMDPRAKLQHLTKGGQQLPVGGSPFSSSLPGFTSSTVSSDSRSRSALLDGSIAASSIERSTSCLGSLGLHSASCVVAPWPDREACRAGVQIPACELRTGGWWLAFHRRRAVGTLLQKYRRPIRPPAPSVSRWCQRDLFHRASRSGVDGGRLGWRARGSRADRWRDLDAVVHREHALMSWRVPQGEGESEASVSRAGSWLQPRVGAFPARGLRWF
jgi:hypothetical protein